MERSVWVFLADECLRDARVWDPAHFYPLLGNESVRPQGQSGLWCWMVGVLWRERKVIVGKVQRGGRKGVFVDPQGVLSTWPPPQLCCLRASCHGCLPLHVSSPLGWESGTRLFLSIHSLPRLMFTPCAVAGLLAPHWAWDVRDPLVRSDVNSTSHHMNVLFAETISLPGFCLFLFLIFNF